MRVLTGRTRRHALLNVALIDVGLPTLRLEPRQIRKEATVLHSECGGPLPFCLGQFAVAGGADDLASWTDSQRFKKALFSFKCVEFAGGVCRRD